MKIFDLVVESMKTQFDSYDMMNIYEKIIFSLFKVE